MFGLFIPLLVDWLLTIERHAITFIDIFLGKGVKWFFVLCWDGLFLKLRQNLIKAFIHYFFRLLEYLV